jgi:nucleoside-diphosphate-sugar epimerase
VKVLVTGGTGFLGRRIVERLVARGDEVRILARGVTGTGLPAGAESRRGDVEDAAEVAEALRGCEVVFHTAAMVGDWGPLAEFRRTNVEGTRNVLEACRLHGVRRLVHTSTPSVVFDGRDMEGVDESVPYARTFEAAYPETKAEAERLVLAANGPALATTALRPHLVWGPGDTHLVPGILARAQHDKLTLVGDGSNRVDSTYIDNAVDAHLAAAERLAPGAPCAGKVYFISNGEPLPIRELLNRILAAGHLPPVAHSAPLWVALTAAWIQETLFRLLNKENAPLFTRFVVREMATAHWFDITAAKRDLGWTPRVSIDEGMVRLEDWIRHGGGR